MYLKYAYDETSKFECAVPVIKPPLYKKIISFFYPDSISPLPKRKGSYTSYGFKETVFFDAYKMGLEEYMWQGMPFGTHIRGKGDAKKEMQAQNMRGVLKHFAPLS